MTARFTVAVIVTFVIALAARPASALDTGPGLEAYDDAVRTYVEGGEATARPSYYVAPP